MSPHDGTYPDRCPHAQAEGQSAAFYPSEPACKEQTMPIVSIPLPEWIERARSSVPKEGYAKSSVSVALELTKHLSLVVGEIEHPQFNDSFNSSFSSANGLANINFDFSPSAEEKNDRESAPPTMSFLSIQIEDIVPENVIVSVSNNSNAYDTSCANLLAAEVSIQPAESKPSDIFKTPRLLQRNVCFALGKVLFELFSQGYPLFLISIDCTDDANEGSVGNFLIKDLDINAENYDTSHPATKKSSLPSTDATIPNAPSTTSMKAKIYLQGQGLPLSICQLVSDLLEAEEGNAFISDTALLSLDEAQFDLMRMITQPERFLYDQTCPRVAWERTTLSNPTDGELYGREKEMDILRHKAARVSLHALSQSGADMNGGQQKGGNYPGTMQVNDLLCEAVVLSGHSGSGKSSIIRNLVSFCNSNDWFVLTCKFDRQVAPLSALLQSFDNFFAAAFDRISQSIVSSIDSESFSQLCELLPNLCRLLLLPMDHVQTQRRQNANAHDDLLASFTTQTGTSISSPGVVGSGSNRLNYLLHIIFKALFSEGHPVIIVLDDLQWSGDFTMDIISDLIQTVGYSSAFSGEEDYTRGKGLLLVASYRDNEVKEDGLLLTKMNCMELSNRNINVSRISVGELPEHEVNKMLSFKFCLPMRHTRELAQVVHQKTRGNPLYIVEFLRSIIHQNFMFFSVRSRRWAWDDTVVDIQMISKGVVALLTIKLRQLPNDVIETLKVASCFGQLNVSTIQLLDLGQFVPDMLGALDVAVKEGIIERAGPLFAFSHDMLQESTYNLIPIHENKLLHKKIARNLVQDKGVADNAELCKLAVDQINMCKDVDGLMDPEERAQFARLNLAAGKHSIAASSFEQARGYLEAGISLLHSNCWDKQYSLCLELHEMSVVVSFMDGQVETVSSRLDAILRNVKSFDDSLNIRALRARFFASQEKYAEANNELLDILSKLGEKFPRDASLSHVTSEISAVELILKDVTRETVLNLPIMTDGTKLNAMKFLCSLIPLGNFFSPILIPLSCCRMMKLTFEFGFCEDSISGLAFMSYALLHYSDDVQLASRMGRIAESLIRGNHNEHSLRARLNWWTCGVKCIVEPFQTTVDHCLNGYNSAKIVGDVDHASLCGVAYCIACIFAIPDLMSLQRHMVIFLHQLAKHKQIGVLHSAMSFFNVVTSLIGREDSSDTDTTIEMKTNRQLHSVAEQTQNKYLVHHTIIAQMYVHCYFRDNLTVANLAEKHEHGAKRILDFYFCFYEGISALCLARDTKQEKWRKIGLKSVKTMMRLENYCTWNFENMLKLLQAECYYLEKRHTLAELSYQAAIVSAHEHRFFHEEALAYELYGVYLVENKMVGRGLEQLQAAKGMYRQWGASKKVDDVKDFMELVKQSAFWGGKPD